MLNRGSSSPRKLVWLLLLSRELVRQYVRTIGFPVIPSHTSPLWDLLTTPLMLHRAETQNQMLTAYVERRLAEAPSHAYPTTQTMLYLAWLASQMQHHNQTMFYVERMQPAWLLPSQQRILRIGSGLLGGLIFGLLGGFIFGVIYGLLFGLTGGLIFGLGADRAIVLTETVQWSIPPISDARLGAALWADHLAALRATNWVDMGLLFGLLGGLMWGPIIGLMWGLSSKEVAHRTSPNQGIARSARFALLVGLMWG